jgi:hypothetical protein
VTGAIRGLCSAARLRATIIAKLERKPSMFEIVCEIINKSGKTVTLEMKIPEAVDPVTNVLENGQMLGVFSPTDSTVQITITSVQEADSV